MCGCQPQSDGHAACACGIWLFAHAHCTPTNVRHVQQRLSNSWAACKRVLFGLTVWFALCASLRWASAQTADCCTSSAQLLLYCCIPLCSQHAAMSCSLLHLQESFSKNALLYDQAHRHCCCHNLHQSSCLYSLSSHTSLRRAHAADVTWHLSASLTLAKQHHSRMPCNLPWQVLCINPP